MENDDGKQKNQNKTENNNDKTENKQNSKTDNKIVGFLMDNALILMGIGILAISAYFFFRKGGNKTQNNNTPSTKTALGDAKNPVDGGGWLSGKN